MSAKENIIEDLFKATDAEITRSFQTEEAMKEYLDFRMKIDNYSVHNMTMVKVQCPRAQVVRSYQFWKEQGAFIHKGEQGIKVLIPSDRGSNGSPAFKIGYVFDVAQTTLDEGKKQELLHKDIREQIKKEDEEHFLQGIMVVGKMESLDISFSVEECKAEHGMVYPVDRTIFINPDDDVHTQAMTAARLLAFMILQEEQSETVKVQLQSEMVLYMLQQYYGMDGQVYLASLKNSQIQGMKPKEEKKLVDGAYKVVQRLTEKLDLYLKEHPVVEQIPQIREEAVSQTQPERKKIEDFGKKIGGAKKDLWKERGLQVTDLEAMNDRETDKYVTKDNIWKKPDYDKMIQEGTPIRIAYFTKKIRDALPAKVVYSYQDKTEEQRRKRQENYINLIRDVMNMTEQVKEEADMFHFLNQFVRRGDYVIRAGYYMQQTEKGFGVTKKLLQTMLVSKDSLALMDRKIKKEQFGVADKEKIPRGFQIRYLRQDGKYCVLQNRKVVAEGLESEEDAIKCARELYKNTNKTRKKKFIPPQLEHIQRDGPANGISEDNPADGDRYMKDFGFSGGEFGNWMSEADRQASLNMGYDAFCDLAYALGIDREEISLNNQLSIAFGARGSGTAMAHYEPDRQVINLTKMKGAGSLAHEWGHAFDDFVGRHLGLNGFMSANIYSDAVPQSMRDLVMAMKWKPATDSEKNESVLKRQKRADYLLGQIFQGVGVESKLNESQMVEWKQLKENIIKTVKEHSADDCEIKWVEELVEELSAFKSKITGHIISKSNRDQMIFMIRSAKAAYEFKPDKLCVETDFYKNSVKADAAYSKESKGYWHSEEEMFARAFACYVKDRLPWRSDYLCGHSESAGFYEYVNEERVWIKAIPQGEERENLNRCFDRVIEECKQLEIFKPQQMMQRTVRKAR